jgi:hypothetical protein
VVLRRKVADHTLGVDALGDLLDEAGGDARTERLLEFEPAEVVLVRPAGGGQRLT